MKIGVELINSRKIWDSDIWRHFGIADHEWLLALIYRVIDGEYVLYKHAGVYPKFPHAYLASVTLYEMKICLIPYMISRLILGGNILWTMADLQGIYW